MTTRLKVSLGILFVFQLVVAGLFGLAHDEAYYWLFSRHLDWGFFDHPPFVAVLIRYFSFLGHHELSVRAGFICIQFLTVFLVMDLVPERHKTKVLFLFFAFPLASIGGMLALPDMPLLFMTAVYAWLLRNYLEKDDLKNSCSLGAAIALLFYAKYHGVLLVFFTLLAIPKLLQRKSFYIVTLVAILIFLPHMWWQYSHNFATLRYHFLERPSSSFSFKRSFEFVFLQVILAGLLAGPVVWWGVIKHKTTDQFERSLKFISIGSVIFFLISSLSKKTEANWTVYLTVPLIILTLQHEIWDRKWVQRLLYVSFGIVLLARLVFVFDKDQLPLKRLGEFNGWRGFALGVKIKCGHRVIMANSYQIAAKLSYYLKMDVPALNYHSRKNQFDFWRFDLDHFGQPVCYVTDKKKFMGQIVTTPEGKELHIVHLPVLPRELEPKHIQIEKVGQ